MVNPRYPRKRIKTWSSAIVVVLFLLLSVSLIYSFYLISKIRLQIDLPVAEPLQVYSDSKSYGLPSQDPCLEVRTANDSYKSLVNNQRVKMAQLMADLAFEIEIGKKGSIPSARIADLLRKYDNTQKQIYNKLYPTKK